MNTNRLLTLSKWVVGLALLYACIPLLAHDPIFGLGPHVLYKGGIESAIELHREETGDKIASEVDLEIVYGLTGDWAAGIDIPYAQKEQLNDNSNGLSDIALFTKYRFWRHDTLGVQKSAAFALKLNLGNGNETDNPPLGNGATDIIAGLTYGYESLKWYRWASVRYRYNGVNKAGFRVGDKWLVDIVGGWRPSPPKYLLPDTVWLLELNTEFGDKSDLNANELANSGGNKAFLSPGLFWTLRNFAIKAGLQIPIYSDLNGSQEKSDYRAKVSFEWHV